MRKWRPLPYQRARESDRFLNDPHESRIAEERSGLGHFRVKQAPVPKMSADAFILAGQGTAGVLEVRAFADI